MKELEFKQNFTEYGNTVILLVSGKAGTGKTRACKELTEYVDTLGYLDFTTMHFAGELKTLAREKFGWDGIKNKKGRRLLQEIGKTGRNYDEDIWAKYLLAKIQQNPGMYDFVFVDDWRFPNEGKYLAENSNFDVVTLRLHAPSREILKGTPEYLDASETALSDNFEDYDYNISNEGTEEELKRNLALVLVKIIKSQMPKEA